jgi:hypothetical protein
MPVAKVAFFSHLLPGMLRGKDEFTVSGAMCEVRIGAY